MAQCSKKLCTLRLLLWLILLATVGLVLQSVIVTHQTYVRGIPNGFPAPVTGADVPILGVNVALEQYDNEELEVILNRVAEGGFTWVRQVFYWDQIEPNPGHFDWTIPDRIIAALGRHSRLRLVAVLDERSGTPPTDPSHFAHFAGAFAARYGSRVTVYQIWDEPNLAKRWGGGPVSPPAYADLLARATSAIRLADPSARILLAGLAPTVETGPQNLSDIRYLEQLYQAGAAPYFDAVAGKPYGFYTGPDDRRANEGVLNFSRLLLLREVMIQQGDADKALWASHWGWNALPPKWEGAPSLWGQTDEATQAQHTLAALERARTEWPWVGAMILEHLQPPVAPDDPRWGFALIGPNDAPRPIYDAIVGWATALPKAAPTGGYPAQNPWTTYEGAWRVGAPGADVGANGDRVTFRFDGPSIALTVRRRSDRGFLYVTVDGAPANALPRDEAGRAYVVLYDAEPSIATVPLARELTPHAHTVEVVAQGGRGQWALIDWRVGTTPVRDGYVWKVAGSMVTGLLLAALLIHDARRVSWEALRERLIDWPEWSQVALILGLTGLFWSTAAVSWGRDWGSPWLIVSLATLPPLVGLFALRPDVGLASIALTIPFHLLPGEMFYRALSLPEVLIALCGIGLAIQKPRKPTNARLSTIDRSVALLTTAAVVVVGLVASDRGAALFELRTVFLLPALYYALLRLSHPNAQVKRRLVDAFILGGAGVAIIGLFQYMLGRNTVIAEGGLPRLQSIFSSPNRVGLYLERVWPLLVAIVLWGRSARRRLLYGAALIVVTLALVLSFSRGALLLGVPAAVLAMGWGARGRYRWIALALVLIGALAMVPLLRLPRFASLLDLERGSTFFRLELWRSSLALIGEHPWLGIGPGNFLVAYRTRYVLPSAWQEFNLEHPHNIYLDLWTRLGLLGGSAGIILLIANLRSLLSNLRLPIATPRPIPLGLLGSLAALLAHGLVDNTLFFPDLALAFFLTLALAQ